MNHQNTGNEKSTTDASAPIRVLVVDDHPAFRYGVVELINRLQDAEVCGEAGDGATALKSFRTLKPDLVVMDITLPGRDGIELTKMMRAEAPDAVVLILSMHDEALYGLRALRAGARGYLRKDDALTHLADAVRYTMRHDYYLSPRLMNQLIYKAIHSSEKQDEETALHGLSDREMEVFHWLGKGLGTRQIANLLGLSVKTIETHRAHIKTKLSLSSADEMVRLAKEWKDLEERRTNGETKIPAPENT